MRYFGDLFSAQPGHSIAEVIRVAQLFPSFVDEEANRMLMGEVSVEELSRVLHSFQKDKSSGPDGWPVEFFLGFFDFFDEELLSVVEESRKAGFIHGPFNSTFIALISKKDKPTSFEDFRPISLCNCI